LDGFTTGGGLNTGGLYKFNDCRVLLHITWRHQQLDLELESWSWNWPCQLCWWQLGLITFGPCVYSWCAICQW